jgi:hypothetical protein
MDTLGINSQMNLMTSQIGTEYLARVLVLQKNVMQQQGDSAIKLIQSAVLPSTQGQNLDVKA